jgi:hypothetical protein
MGLSNETREKKTYVGINHSFFTIRAREGDDGAVSRTNKNGDVVWEKRYPRIEGTIDRVYKQITDWQGKKLVTWNIAMTDVLNTFIVSLPYKSKEAGSLLKKLPNIDLDLPVTFAVGTFEDKKTKGKMVPYMTIYQNGAKVEPFYTKDNLPKPGTKKQDGLEVPDYGESEDLFEKMVAEMFPPVKVDVEVVDDPDTTPAAEDNNDLPF